ncbi:hypothetical protein GN244_ATG19642 [Phytophthora infestans]|uniref:Uncharacterized protein n=1 Tax=Phytophthora infestans TaxID=4787 RepID=A0A833RYF7_PHYIN|nr:hypothetical protein GN244_ATG19642 [Phytophthora infestans]
MNEVVGDDGILELRNASKTERWVEITERLGSALSKKLFADGVRKHVDKLGKEYRSKRAKERAMSGQEPHKSIDENELERLMEVYFQKKDDETLVHSKRTESKTKKIEEDRAKGLAVREAALSTEKHTTKKSKPAKAPSAFDFLERLEKRADKRREQDLERLRSERAEREDRDRRLAEQSAKLAAEQAEAQRRMTELMAKALMAIATIFPQQNN